MSKTNKIKLIIAREYLSRVKKKSFLVMTILGPLLLAGMMLLVIWLGSRESMYQNILVVDDNYPIFKYLESSPNIKFNYSDMSLEEAKKIFHSSDYTAILYLPKNILISNKGMLYFKKQPGNLIIKSIENKVEDQLEQIKLAKNNIPREIFYKVKTNFNLATYKFKKSGEEQKVSPEITYVGFFFSIVIYMFIFMYSVQVMRGVLEEKTNRIVEVIISSVKPFQLMMGKIIGVAMVGLTQFLLWVILTLVLFQVGQSVILNDIYDPAELQKAFQMTPEMMKEVQQEQQAKALAFIDSDNIINRINFPLMIGMFLFYFIGGYLLYSALFAAIGAAVDNDADTQQFMLPVTMPLIFAYAMSGMIIQNPEGPASLWLSLIPFTSPVIMMIRVAIGFEASDMWQLFLSMALLITGFVLTTWLAAKIYRAGILMYGKKPSWKDLWKWIK